MLAARRITACAIFVCFLAIVFFECNLFVQQFPWTYSWSELFLKQGGFAKRALLGEIAFHLDPLIPAWLFIPVVVVLFYALAIGLIVFALGIAGSFPGLMFLASPAGLLLPLLDPPAFARKDIFLVTAFAASIVIITRMRNAKTAFATITAIYIVTSLVAAVGSFACGPPFFNVTRTIPPTSNHLRL